MGRKAGASRAVRAEWARRVEEEYRSASIAQHLTLWLIQIGASPDLVHVGMRIADDEMVHSEMSHAVLEAAGGGGTAPIPRETLELSRTPGDALERDVTRVAVRVFCLGETVAVPLFRRLREGCTVPVARRALDRVLRDEVRHRDFGWSLLTWLLEHPMAPALRKLAEASLPADFARLRGAYGARPEMTEIDAKDRAWGLMSPSEYAAATERTLERDWIPRFGKLGIDARRAWSASG
ncbi:MAG TPA: ferritin-like domain-containing protein [Polyangiaceae bacterium]|nr:ferritin-like domain-containing protein [Polyangiaceae bacterium]